MLYRVIRTFALFSKLPPKSNQTTTQAHTKTHTKTHTLPHTNPKTQAPFHPNPNHNPKPNDKFNHKPKTPPVRAYPATSKACNDEELNINELR